MPKLAFFLTEGFLTIAALAVLGGYHAVLIRQVRHHPGSTAIGLSARARLAWVASVMGTAATSSPCRPCATW